MTKEVISTEMKLKMEWSKGFVAAEIASILGIAAFCGIVYASGSEISVEPRNPEPVPLTQMVQARKIYDQACLQKHRISGTPLGFVASCVVWPRPAHVLVPRY